MSFGARLCIDVEGAVWYADVGSQHCVRVREGPHREQEGLDERTVVMSPSSRGDLTAGVRRIIKRRRGALPRHGQTFR
jgi:hypothetical protein